MNTSNNPKETILAEFKAVLNVYISPEDQEYLRETGEKERLYSKLDAYKFCLTALGVTGEEIQSIIKEAHKNK